MIYVLLIKLILENAAQMHSNDFIIPNRQASLQGWLP